jgi:hypothetical protein
MADKRNPLLEPAIVAHVFSYVGAGQFLFIGTVSKFYKQIYEKLENQTLTFLNDRDWPEDVVCTARMTLYRAAFASVACLKWASESRCRFLLWKLCHKPATLLVIEECAGQFGDLDTLIAARKLGLRCSERVVLGAARSGSLSKLKFLLNERQRSGYSELVHWEARRVCELAARSGNVEMLQWLKGQGFEFNYFTFIAAASAGQLQVCEYLHTEGCEWNDFVTSGAATEGHTSVLTWLVEHGCPYDEQSICNAAACSGNLQTLVAAKQHGSILTAHTMGAAARYGTLAMCQYLHAEQCPYDADCCKTTAESDNVDILRWLLQQGCPMNADKVCTAAAAGGHIDVMSFLQSALPSLTTDMWTEMLNAAGGNSKLAAAQWLRQRGAEWPAVLQYRSKAWQSEVLAWARAEGCTSSVETH